MAARPETARCATSLTPSTCSVAQALHRTTIALDSMLHLPGVAVVRYNGGRLPPHVHRSKTHTLVVWLPPCICTFANEGFHRPTTPRPTFDGFRSRAFMGAKTLLFAHRQCWSVQSDMISDDVQQGLGKQHRHELHQFIQPTCFDPLLFDPSASGTGPNNFNPKPSESQSVESSRTS